MHQRIKGGIEHEWRLDGAQAAPDLASPSVHGAKRGDSAVVVTHRLTTPDINRWQATAWARAWVQT